MFSLHLYHLCSLGECYIPIGISINYQKCVYAYECNHAHLWPRLGQDCAAHALCAAHAEVEALGGRQCLIWPNQVKKICWGRSRARGWDRGRGRCRTCCHGSKKVISACVDRLSRCWHLTSWESIPVAKISIAGRSWCWQQERDKNIVASMWTSLTFCIVRFVRKAVWIIASFGRRTCQSSTNVLNSS